MLKDVFIIREGDVIDFMKAKRAREPIDPNDMKLSFDDYANGPFPYQDYTPRQQIDFYKFYIKKHGNQELGADEWNALHDEFDEMMSRKLRVVHPEEE